MRYKLEKLEELADAEYKNIVPVGYIDISIREISLIRPPVIGKCFHVFGELVTSIVQEIIDERTFRTVNSIYRWEEVK